jgi:hypothetical protein
MAYDLLTVWNPQTRLGRAAPRGGPMILLHAANLEEISVNDVKWASIGLGTLPTNIARPVRPEPEAEPAPDGQPLAESPSTGIESSAAADPGDGSGTEGAAK